MPESRITHRDPQGEFVSDLPEYFFQIAFQLAKRRETAGEALMRSIGRTMAEWRALLIIDTLQPCTMNDLSKVSSIDRTTLTRTIDQLVIAGLAERTTPPEDRRQVRLTLTPAGVDALDQGKALLYPDQRALLDGTDPDDLRVACRVLRDLVSKMLADPLAVQTFAGSPTAGDA